MCCVLKIGQHSDHDLFLRVRKHTYIHAYTGCSLYIVFFSNSAPKNIILNGHSVSLTLYFFSLSRSHEWIKKNFGVQWYFRFLPEHFETDPSCSETPVKIIELSHHKFPLAINSPLIFSMYELRYALKGEESEVKS